MPPISTPRRLAGAGRWLGLVALVAMTALPASAQRTVTLRMNSATMPDTLRADQALAGAQVRGQLGSGTALPGGGVIDWNANTTVRPTNVGGDNWQVQFQIPDNDLLNFKFYFEQSDPALPAGPGIGGWEDGDNHQIPAGTGDVTLDLHYFNKTGGNQPYDWRPFAAGGDSVAVWFRVYMNTENAIVKGYTRDDAALRVSLRGNFGGLNAQGAGGTVTDWGSTAGAPEALLTRESNDPAKPGYDLFSGLIRYPAASAGMVQNYKFFFEDTGTTGDGGYEDGDNRTFTIPAAGTDTTLFYRYYSNSPAVVGNVVTSDVTFAVDIQPLVDSGIFSRADDAIQVRGGFNGWDCPAGNDDDCALVSIPGTVTYTRQIPITAIAGGDLGYKYFVSFVPALPNPDNGYEEPLDFGGGDRSFNFTGAAGGQALGTQFFNGIRAANVIPAGRTVNLGFTVDMRPALAFAPRAFNPATDDVTIFFQDPIWNITQGRPSASDTPVPGFVLTDTDGDGIYTGSIPVVGPTYNGIGYQAAFGNATDGYYSEGSGGFQAGRRRYRYITDAAASTFQFARDTFRPNTAGNPLPWEINPTGPFVPGEIPNSVANGFVDNGTVANEGGPGRAGALQLSALMPNPTTGIARMTVRTAEGEVLTVRVYDVMGRLVQTVVEGTRSTGEQQLQVDTQGLAAGVYVVRATSGTSVATRRLTVIR